MSFNLKEYKGKKVHIIGIGGSMMSGIAGILLDNGVKVSGSDFMESRQLDNVRKLGASIKGEHHRDNVYDQDLVIYTAAIKDDNPELVKAKELNIPVMKRSEFLGNLMDNFSKSVGVAGTNGKSTVTSMLTSITMTAGLDPTVLIGAHIGSLGGNYRLGNSQVMVVESCEYKRNFLDFPPKIAIINNIEQDHVDVFKNLNELKDAFRSYINGVKPDGIIIANADDEEVMDVVKDSSRKIVTFGINNGAFRAKNMTHNEEGFENFDLYEGNNFLFNVQMPVAGLFNVYNALASMVAALSIGATKEKVQEGIQGYSGVDRRLQELGTIDGVRFIDDYGHIPSAVKLAISAVKKFKHRKLIVVNQPHTFSRLNYFFDDFVESFHDADNLILLPVFAAREADTGHTSSEKLGDAIREKTSVPTLNAKSYEEAAQMVKDMAKPGDIVLLIGAGQGYKVYDILKADNEIKSKKNIKDNL